MVHSDRDLTSHFYETVCQRLPWTSRFVKQSVRVPLGQVISVNWKWT